MKKNTQSINWKQKNKRRGRTLTSLLLAVMLTFGCICTGTVQTRAAVKSASTNCSHNWVTDFGNVGHIEYEKRAARCGCSDKIMSFNGYLRHRLETDCMFNWYALGKDYGKSLGWCTDDYKVCSICGERKITKPKNPDTSYLGAFNKEKITVNDLNYKFTGLWPEKTVTLVKPDDLGYYIGDHTKAFAVPDTISKIIRIKYGDVRKKETLKVTGIGANAFQDFMYRKITLGTNIETISKNAFKGICMVENIVIKSTKLTDKSVANGAFNGLSKKMVITVPKSKLGAYKKLFKQKGFKGKVKAGKWKEKNDSGSSSTETPDSSTENVSLDLELVKTIDTFDSYLVEWTKDDTVNFAGAKPGSEIYWSFVRGDIENNMGIILAYMDDDIMLEVHRELGGKYTIKEFLEAYCRKDPGNDDIKPIISYVMYRLSINYPIFG